MKYITLFGYLALLFILSTAPTCTDHRDVPPVARFRVKTVNYVKPGGFIQDGLYIFTYGNDGRLESFSNERDFERRYKTGFVSYSTNVTV